MSGARPGSPYDRIRASLRDGGPVLLDGAMGSELVRRGVRWRWNGLRTDADRVLALHEAYIAAGADVVRTNTFGINDRLYRNVFRDLDHLRHIGAPGLETRAAELLATAVEVAHAAREASGREVAIAGVLAPLEHPYRPDLAPDPEAARAEHAAVAMALAEAGADLLLLESMNTVAEARAATEAARETGLPVWVGFVLGPEGEILSGEPLAEGARSVRELGAEVVLVNGAPPDAIGPALAKLLDGDAAPAGALALVGRFEPPSWKFEFHPQFTSAEAWPPDRYAEAARGWRDRGARVVGGCCGTTPAHVAALCEAL